jgi:hypothetical protein
VESGELEGTSAHLAAIASQMARLVRIQLARARLHAGRTAFLVLGAIVLALVTTAAALSGVRLFVRGLTAGLAELAEGRVWLAELWSGLLLLAGTAVALVFLWSWCGRRIVREYLERGGDESSS